MDGDSMIWQLALILTTLYILWYHIREVRERYGVMIIDPNEPSYPWSEVKHVIAMPRDAQIEIIYPGNPEKTRLLRWP